jgi:hypothetical protein
MNRRRRLSACRSFSMETLERRSMLAADCVEGSFAAEAIDHINEVFQDEVFQDEVFQDEVFQDEVFQDEVVQEIPTDVGGLPYDTSEDSPLPYEVVPMDDTADSLLVSGEAEPVTELEEPFIGMDFGVDDGQALEASFSLLVFQPVFQFETTGSIFKPEVGVDPVLTSDVTTGVSHLQFIDGDIWNSWKLVESGLHLTSEIVDLPTNPELDADTIRLVYDRSIFWCGVGVQADSGDVDTVAAPGESPAADSISDDEAPVVTSSSGGSSPSTATSAATAQAFAAFSASFGQGTSFGQGGGDVQSGLPIVGGRRTARRSMG